MTVATVLTAVRDLLLDEPWEAPISSAYSAAGTSLTIATYYTELVQGDVLDFGYDGTYEQFRVLTTPTTSAVSVKIAHNGTTNANHSSGATFLKNPRYGSQQIVNAITHVVNTRLYPDLWVVTDTTITPNPTVTNIYDLPTDYLSFIALVQTATSSIEDLVYVRQIEEVPHVPDAMSTSNMALRVTQWPRTDVVGTLFYRARPTTTNMTAIMEPVIALGTAAYLLSTESSEKADRPDEDDRPGRMLRTSRELERRFEDEKQRLRVQLMAQWGTVRRFKR